MRKNRINMIKEIIKEANKNALLLEGKFDDALIGTAIGFGGEKVASYDASKCIEILISKYNMDETDAFEQFNLTVLSNNKKNNRPVFVTDFRKIKIIDTTINENETIKSFMEKNK